VAVAMGKMVPTQQVVMERAKLKQWQWHYSRPGSAASDVNKNNNLRKPINLQIQW